MISEFFSPTMIALLFFFILMDKEVDCVHSFFPCVKKTTKSLELDNEMQQTLAI